MVRWEDAFMEQREKVAPPPPSSHEDSFPSGVPSQPRLNDFRAPAERERLESHLRRKADQRRRKTDRKPPLSQRERFQRKTQRRKSTQAFPPTLARLHNHLDDIWTNIMLEAGGKPGSLMVCGATAGENSMMVAFHLALFLALGHNYRTLFVDTNVNAAASNPYVQAASPNGGLTGYFADHRPIQSVVARTEYDNFFVIPSGSETIQDKSRNVIIEADDLNALINFSKENFDIAIFASQPVVARPAMLKVARAVEHVAMVCRYGHSRYEVSRLAVHRFQENNISLLGIVLTDREYPVPQWVYKILK